MTRREAVHAATTRLEAAGIPADEARGEARSLTRFALNLTVEDLFLSPEAVLTPAETERWNRIVARREAREPFAYIIGERAFYGLLFRVTPAVLIPRPETELLVEIALKHIAPLANPQVLDVGTGSGCIAIAIAKHCPTAQVSATDISPKAITVARENAQHHGVAVAFYHTDLFVKECKNVDENAWDVVVSNPPYIAPEEIETLQPEVRDWEPRLALGTDPNPFVIYHRLARESYRLLKSTGLLAVEVGQGQAETIAEILHQAGYTQIQIHNDLAKIPRVVTGSR
jgi:release factor glutamine methyltransferase